MKRKILSNTKANCSSLSNLPFKALRICLNQPAKLINHASCKHFNNNHHHSSFISPHNFKPQSTTNKQINFQSNNVPPQNNSFLTSANSKSNHPIKLHTDKQCKFTNGLQTPSDKTEHQTKLIKHVRSRSSNLTSSTSQSELTVDNNHLLSSDKQNSSLINHCSPTPSFRSFNNSLSPITPSLCPVSLADLHNLYTCLHKIVSHLNTAVLPSLNELLRYWNLFYSSSFRENIKSVFRDTNNKSQLVSFTHLDSLCILVSIDLSLKNEILSSVLSSLKSIFGFMHFNLLLIIKYILAQHKHDHRMSQTKSELLKAIDNGLSDNICTNDMKEHYVLKLLQYNVNQIALYYKDIVNQCYLVPQCSLVNSTHSKASRAYNQNTSVSFSISLHEDANHSSTSASNETQGYAQGIISKFFIDGFNHLGEFLYSQYNLVLFEYILKNINVDSIAAISNKSNTNNSETVNNISRDINIHNGNNAHYNNINATTPRFNNERNHIAHRRTQSENAVLCSPTNNMLISSRISFNSETPNVYDYDLSPNNGTSRPSPSARLQGKAFHSPLYYLPSISSASTFSLVLDLDEILIHVKRSYDAFHPTSTRAKVMYRPYLFSFLSRMKKIYEIILFTVNLPEYSNKILKLIEAREKFFTFKLYRQHITFMKNKDYIKDISKLGRDLRRTIVVDNMPQNILQHKANGIIVKSFYGDNSYDLTLNKLGSILERVRYDKEDADEVDIRQSLKKYGDKIKELLD